MVNLNELKINEENVLTEKMAEVNIEGKIFSQVNNNLIN